jgi:ABC-type nickel/cobalt efflux system permease component RcnA
MKAIVLLSVFLVPGLFAHPLGNFSVSHYSRIEVTARGVQIRYVLDLAEIPTYELLQQWKLDAGSPPETVNSQAASQARKWVRNLKIEIGGRAVEARFVRASATLDQGAGGMPILRITADLHVEAVPGALRYEDANYPDRAGWKEIVIVPGEGAQIDQATPGGADRSKALTSYPQDPLLAPPQDLRAEVRWRSNAPLVTERTEPKPAASEVAPPQPEPASAAVAQPGHLAPGTVVRGDFLSRLLYQGEIGWGMMLAGLLVAFGLGAIHAMSPGHGKTIVAAYLVGARGTPKHAAFLGFMVTFTHTISVFFLGFVTLFLSRYVLPEKIYPVLGAISGISIVWIGTTLFYKRMRTALGRIPHPHHHPHNGSAPVHDHGDGHAHSHVPEGDISMGSLIALGASGGLVPCPSALVLLLSSVALGRIALGLTLLVAFSSGLAVVLTAVGLAVLYAKHLLPDSKKTATNLAFRYLPVASAAIIVCAGIIMTGVALGVIRPFAGV